LIVTLHDLNSLPDLPPPSVRSVIVELLKGPLRPAVRLVRQAAQGRLKLGQLVRPLWDFAALNPFLLARWAAAQAQTVFVLTGVEKQVLETLGITSAAVHVPHFVGPRTPSPTTESGKTVVVAGHMFPSKGHELVIEAMVHAPSIRVVFVGGNSPGTRVDELMDLARAKGVRDRLTVTGFLPDEEYARQLAAGDLAVCAFGPNKSASGSLAALVAADCPILASDIPVVAEYNDVVPGAVHTFAPSTPKVLAERIEELLAVPRADLTKGLEGLRDRMSIARVVDRHLDKYRLALSGARRRARAAAAGGEVGFGRGSATIP
jgi:glycosyltransferase involved in cell wall biosynthesis